jgi:hypothetical protein
MNIVDEIKLIVGGYFERYLKAGSNFKLRGRISLLALAEFHQHILIIECREFRT